MFANIHRRRGAALLVLVLAAGPLGGQAPAARQALEGLRGSLAAATDTAGIGALAAAPADTSTPARALADLRRGLVELRLAEAAGPRHYRLADAAFGRAVRREPGWPWPRYGRALAKFGISEAQRAEPLEIGTGVGVGALDDAIASLTAAITLEPSFEPALADLGRFAERLRRPDFWQRGLAALRLASDSARRDPAVLLALGRMEREAGNADSALAAFDAYLGTGGDRGSGLLEIARTRLAAGAGDSIGAAAYYDGAALDDSLSVAGYRDDIAILLSAPELAAFDSTRGDARARWLRTFWSGRDAVELRASGERLAEHYRRLLYARKHFALAVTRRHFPLGCRWRTGNTDFDDRGVIYLRHGEPSVRVRPTLVAMMPNESWRYTRADGDLIFHFGAGTAVDDYRLLSSALDVYGACAVLPLATTVAPPEVYESRAAIDPMYEKLASEYGTMAGGRLAQEEQRIGAASIAVALRSDTYERLFPRRLAAAISLAAVGQEGDRALVHVVYGLAGGHLDGIETAGEWRYPVRLQFVAYDSLGRVGAAADTSVILTTKTSVAAGSMLFGRFAVPTPPGLWRYRLSLRQGDSTGVTLPRDSIRVGRFDGPLSMSDPVLGWRPIALTWPRDADTVFFSPFHSYFGANELELYYEVYGMRTGSPYQTELQVSERKGSGDRPAKVRVRFGGSAAPGITSGRRTLDLAQFRPGAYWLDLVVTDEAGRSVRRRTWFEVKAQPKGRR